MIILVRKNNIFLVILAVALLAVIFSLNFTEGDSRFTLADRGVIEKTIVIDAGHGGEDPGKVSSYSGLKEKDLNLSIAKKTRDLLKDEFTIIMTREEDVLQYEEGTTDIYSKRLQDLTRRKKIMDECNGIVVSIHANSFPESKYYGAQTFYPPNSPDSKKLAYDIQESIRKNLDPTNKREPQLKSDPIVILKNLKTPTVIIETGFLSNPQEEAKLATEEYQDKVARAIAEGIRNFYK